MMREKEHLKAVQSKKALLAMYVSEGGVASSGRTAQFMKALTRTAWSLRKTNFFEARAVRKSKFLCFLDLCARKVNILE